MTLADPLSPSVFEELGVLPSIAAAMEARGFTAPTPVQSALLDPELGEGDLLVSAQTGSGKTVAFGLLLAPALQGRGERTSRPSRDPVAMVIAPTRELAMQVKEELSWLLAPLGARVVVVTGGTNVGGELRALGFGADVVVGTPGRLKDHLERGSLVPSEVATVVLDEADEMLDMGFRDELEAILKTLPAERRTLMLSATLPREITDLAQQYQRDPLRVAIDPPGAGNANITHVAHLISPEQQADALVNVLLASPEERTLVFTRTRAGAAELGATLLSLGFAAAALTGEMVQRDRTQTLDAFRAGRVTTLVATDVAARGIDVPEVSRVVHVDLPGDPSTLTHRSGRTGRAGRKGTSVMLVPPFARRRAEMLYQGAGAKATWVPVPDADAIRAAAEERLRARLLRPVTPEESEAPATGVTELSLADHRGLAATLLAELDAVELVARLLGEVRWDGPCAPRAVKVLQVERSRPVRSPHHHEADEQRRGERHSLSMFRVNFGERQGATPARLLAMVCRRGGVRGADVGAIAIGTHGSTFGVADHVAGAFAASASRTDHREPHIRIERMANRERGPGDGERFPHHDRKPTGPRPHRDHRFRA